MEVATIITSSEDTISLFDKFIYSYPKLCLINRDNDTAYFKSVIDDKEKLYYHYKLNDPQVEFNYNYSEKEIIAIKEHFGRGEFFMFDLSFMSEGLLAELLSAFNAHLRVQNEVLTKDILISHPFNELKNLKKAY